MTTKDIMPVKAIRDYAKSDIVRERFSEILGEHRAGAYINSVVLAVANSPTLQKCTPVSLVSSALRAATLQLSCDPSLGQAYLVPFKDTATLIIGYKGLVDLAIRTGKYRYINVSPLYEGEYIEFDRITGAGSLAGEKKSNKIGGYVASFQMVNGFSKTIYMTLEEIHEHAKKYSRGYSNPKGVWKTNPEAMERKTPLRVLLTQWGYLDANAQEIIEGEDDGETLLDIPEPVVVIPDEDPDPQPSNEADLKAALGFE